MFRVEKLLFVPISSKVSSMYYSDNFNKISSPKEDQQFIDMIQNVAKEKAFYFSYSIDLTKSIQTNIHEATLPSIVAGTASQSTVHNELHTLYPNSIGYIPKFAFNSYLLKEFE